MRYDPNFLDSVETFLKVLKLKGLISSGITGKGVYYGLEPELFEIFWRKGFQDHCFPIVYEVNGQIIPIHKFRMKGFLLLNPSDFALLEFWQVPIPAKTFVFCSRVIPKGTYHVSGEISPEQIEWVEKFLQDALNFRKKLHISFERESFSSDQDKIMDFFRSSGKVNLPTVENLESGKLNFLSVKIGNEKFIKGSLGFLSTKSSEYHPLIGFAMGLEPIRVRFWEWLDISLGATLDYRTLPFTNTSASSLKRVEGFSPSIYMRFHHESFPLMLEYRPIEGCFSFRLELSGAEEKAEPKRHISEGKVHSAEPIQTKAVPLRSVLPEPDWEALGRKKSKDS